MSILFLTLPVPKLPAGDDGKLCPRFRGKVAKEIYRCGKGILITGNVRKPLTHAVKQVGAEMTTGFVYSACTGQVEACIGYFSGLGVVRWLYQIASPGKIKNIARLAYNIGALPLTLYSKGAGAVFDLCRISNLEEKWFGERVYIFDDNRLWIEKNFKIAEAFKVLDKDAK